MIRIVLGLAALLALSGCTHDLEVLKDDPAPACLSWSTIYGSGQLSRYHGCDAVRP